MLVRLGRLLVRRRVVVIPALLGVLLLVFPPPAGAPAPLLGLGLACVVCGAALRILAVGLATVAPGRPDAPAEFALGGMYLHCRNPMHLGALLIVGGLLLVHGNPFAFFTAMTIFHSLYRAMVAMEEHYLLRRFGTSYRAYCDEVPRWIPRLRGLLATVRAHPFRWRRVFRRERAVVFAAWTAAILVLLWRSACLEGWSAVESHRLLYASLLAAGLLLYLLLFRASEP